MNTISGKIVVKETALPIPNVLAVLADATAGREAPASLGSRITAARGEFEFQLADEEIQGANGKRADLLLMVLAPEEPGRDQATRVLFKSGELRQAGRIEQCLIYIPAEVLKQAGIPLPIDPSAATPDTRTSVNKLSQALGQRLEFQDEARKLAAQQITRVRAEAEETDRVVERRLIETLTGVTEAQAKRLNIVMPGGDVQGTMWSTVNKNIEERINAGPLVGHVVLTERQAAGFRDGSGNYRNNIPAEQIEPYLYRGRNQTERPGFILRDDPVNALCRAAKQPPLSESASGGSGSGSGSGGASGSGNGAGGDGSSNGELPPLTKEDLPKFVGQLINDMIPLSNGAHALNGQRPDAADVQSSIEGLQLKSGPADVTAFYDFHQLQIAFDYVWQQAVDEGVLETGKALTRQLIERGGDPLPALTNSKDPIRALRREAAHVAVAQSKMLGTGVAYRPTSTSPLGDITGGVFQPPNVPPPPPQPPRPPRNPLGDIVVHPGDFAIDTEPRDLLDMLDDMLQERYKFETFAPGSCNFGLLVTYRQKWQPVTYQVGDLVKTLTLAPKETRKVSSKRVIKKERSRKEMEANQRNRKDETSQTMRDEAEIVQKAQDKTNFSMNAKGSYNIGISKGDSNTTFSRDAESSSQETKKSFHEAVIKAAQEFRDERKIEVESKETDEEEIVDSVEITNPNDELTVTYLFYELQRRFLVSESIHKITPVVLVGMEVPNPNRWAIDRILLGHSWVINRVLLDDRYRPALDYLCNSIVGDERSLQHLSANLATVRTAVEQLKTMHKDMQVSLAAREAAYQAAIEARAEKVGATEGEGIGEKAWEFIAGSGDEEDVEAARILEDQKKEAYERRVREEKDLRMRLDAETAALTDATEAYARAQAEHANHLLQIAGLRAHFKENMLYYMQAIWNFTFQDQIFFQMSTIKVPKITPAQKTYSLVVPAQPPLAIVPKPGEIVLEVNGDVKLNANLTPEQDFWTLPEIANLDKPVGCKGNYMIFELKQSNALTDFMMLPYIDSELGIHDPDDLGSWTAEDFAKYARCLLKQLKGQLSEAEYVALQKRLEEQYRRIVTSPRLLNDEIIVPTTSLYIEALPGAHPLLEDFKLAHRAIDVKKAELDTVKAKMEVLRYAARIIGGELTDPDIERQVLINGNSEHIVVPPDA